MGVLTSLSWYTVGSLSTQTPHSNDLVTRLKVLEDSYKPCGIWLLVQTLCWTDTIFWFPTSGVLHPWKSFFIGLNYLIYNSRPSTHLNSYLQGNEHNFMMNSFSRRMLGVWVIILLFKCVNQCKFVPISYQREGNDKSSLRRLSSVIIALLLYAEQNIFQLLVVLNIHILY